MKWTRYEYEMIDPEYPLSSEERKDILLTISNRGLDDYGSKQSCLIQLLYFLTFIAVLCVGFWGVNIYHSPNPFFIAMSFLFMIGLIFNKTISKPWTRLWQSSIHKDLKRRGYETCRHCDYWLTGLDTTIDSCPECGTLREPLPTTPEDER